MASPGLLAHVMAAKFVDGLPFYRQEAQFLRMGVHIGRATMCGWALKLAEACKALPDLLWQYLRAGPLLQYDESTLQVLDERGRAAETLSYMWAALGGWPLRRAVVFEYSETRSADTPRRRLAGYRGGVQTDDYSGYDFLDHEPGITHYGCFAHVRRKFTDVLKAGGIQPSLDKGTLAEQALDYIRGLYVVESYASDAELTGDHLVAWRHQHAKPILQSFWDWLVRWAPEVPPKSLLGRAIIYTMGYWARLVRYIDNPFVGLDNNLIENAFRPYVVGRKNWLFAATPAGARATALFYTLVETAKLNGIEPYSYLRALFEALPLAQSDDDRRLLLPMLIDRDLVQPYIRPPRTCRELEHVQRVPKPGLLLPVGHPSAPLEVH
jgi:transposase